MSESTLSVSRSEILQAVGDYLFSERNKYNWTRDQLAQVTRCVKTGERQFYNPPGYSWRFLRPTMELSITAGTGDYSLPDDFGGFVADQFLSYAVDDNQAISVRETDVSTILRARQLQTLEATTQPTMFAVSRSTFDGTTGERYTIMLHPTPGSDGTLTGQYYAVPDSTTDAAPYPLGGQPHGDTLLACCMAAAELEKDKKPGPWKQLYTERIAASIAHDKRTGPKTYGYNSDRGAYEWFEYVRNWSPTYNGATNLSDM